MCVSVNDLQQRTTTAVSSVDEDMLRSVWSELDYRIGICLVLSVGIVRSRTQTM
jgi:hypothetical protein